MATQNEGIVITVREDGVPVVTKNFRDLKNNVDAADRSVKSIQDSFKALRSVMATLGGVLFLNELRKYADQWTEVNNRIRVFTSSTEEAAAVHQELFKAVQESRQEMAPMVALYSRTAQAAGTLGATQQQLIQFTENVAKSLSIQGVSTEGARGALLQLGQAMGMAKLRAQEFNSINEQAPIILQTVAKQLYGVNGTVAQLREEMLKGNVRSKEFFDAYLKGTAAIDEQFKKVNPTIGQSFTVLSNAVGRYVGMLDQQTGASANFAKSVVTLANNLDMVAAAAITATPALIAFASPAIAKGIFAARDAVIALNVAIRANPIAAAVTILATLVIAMYEFGDSIKVSSDGLTTLKDVVDSVFGGIVSVVTSTYETVNGYLNQLIGAFTAPFEGTGAAASSAMDSILDTVKDGTNQILGLFGGALNAAVALWDASPQAWVNAMNKVNNAVVSVVEQMLNSITSGINSLFELLNKASSAVGGSDIFNTDLKIDLGKWKAPVEDSFGDIGTMAADAFAKGFNTDYLGNITKDIKSAAQSSSVNSLINQLASNKTPVDLNKAPTLIPQTAGVDEKAAKRAQRELEKLQNSLLQVQKTLDPISAAQTELAKSQDTVNKAYDKGLITLQQRNQYLAMLPELYEKATDPYGTLLKNMAQENSYMLVAAKDQAAYKTVFKEVMDLKKDGVTVTEQMVNQLWQEAKANEALEAVNSRMQAYYQNSADNQRTNVGYDITAASQALQQGLITAEQFKMALADAAVEMGKINVAAGQFTTNDFFNGSLEGVLQGYKGMLPGIQSAFSDFFGSLTSQMSDAIGQLIVQGGSLKDMFTSIAQSITQSLISALVKLGVQYVVNAALANTVGAASVAAGTAMATATAAAWAPAAALVSLASYGANAVAANTALLQTTALAQGIALAGFEKGGYTGNMATNAVAGVVHGKEFVMDAAATSRIGVGNLEALRTGDMSVLNSGSATQNTAEGSGASSMGGDTYNHFTSNNTFNLSATSDRQIQGIVEQAAAKGAEAGYQKVMVDVQKNGPIRKTLKGGK